MQPFTAAKRAFDTCATLGAAGGVLDFLVNAEGIVAVGTGVNDSTEGHGGEEKSSETGEELHFEWFERCSRMTLTKCEQSI